MSATVHRLQLPARPDPDRTLVAAQRAWLADLNYERPWSDSTLIAAYFAADPDDAAEILAELAIRVPQVRR